MQKPDIKETDILKFSDFTNLLDEHDLSLFLYNLILSHGNFIYFFIIDSRTFKDWMNEAFIWGKSKEGHAFWEERLDKYNDKYNFTTKNKQKMKQLDAKDVIEFLSNSKEFADFLQSKQQSAVNNGLDIVKIQIEVANELLKLTTNELVDYDKVVYATDGKKLYIGGTDWLQTEVIVRVVIDTIQKQLQSQTFDIDYLLSNKPLSDYMGESSNSSTSVHVEVPEEKIHVGDALLPAPFEEDGPAQQEEVFTAGDANFYPYDTIEPNAHNSQNVQDSEEQFTAGDSKGNS